MTTFARHVNNRLVRDRVIAPDAASRRLLAAAGPGGGRRQPDRQVNTRTKWRNSRLEAQERARTQEEAVAKVEGRVAELGRDVDAGLAVDRPACAPLRERIHILRAFQGWLGPARQKAALLRAAQAEQERRARQQAAAAAQAGGEKARLAARREILTVDTELDEVMTSFKVTFLGL
ncbi:MAG: hypothetical protein HY775_11790, partial [Acidobacteria bacterium]|nr:hypothetical protein [Acidobacteriota bacterium]